MTTIKNKYDSSLVWLCSHGKEHLIPNHLWSGIPHSTISTWRNTDYSGYYGHELRAVQQQAFDYYELLERYSSLKKTVFVIARIWTGIAGIVMPILQKKKGFEEKFIDYIQHLFRVFPKQQAFKIAGISPTSFYEKVARLKFKCGVSPLQICAKRHPLQLCVAEVQKIKKLFNDTDLACWPATSLYYEGLRNRGLFISLSTFYKYVHVLGLKRKWIKKPHKVKGLSAVRPNQYLHVDTTYWKLENGYKAAIVFVSDNFSRAVLGWNASLKNGAENVIPALEGAVEKVCSIYPKLQNTILVADGGNENHSGSVDSLLQQTKIPDITKVIAQKDIRFSNSPVEAVNKIVKRYLRHYSPTTYKAVLDCIKWIEKDYNYKRPHGSLAGLTPMEAYQNPEKRLDCASEKSSAKSQRIAHNQNVNCQVCKK